jgi:hypothetical protein
MGDGNDSRREGYFFDHGIACGKRFGDGELRVECGLQFSVNFGYANRELNDKLCEFRGVTRFAADSVTPSLGRLACRLRLTILRAGVV